MIVSAAWQGRVEKESGAGEGETHTSRLVPVSGRSPSPGQAGQVRGRGGIDRHRRATNRLHSAPGEPDCLRALQDGKAEVRELTMGSTTRALSFSNIL